MGFYFVVGTDYRAAVTPLFPDPDVFPNAHFAVCHTMRIDRLAGKAYLKNLGGL
jgi:hypothetical protein